MSPGRLHKFWFALGCTWTGLLIKREQRQSNKNVTYTLNKQNKQKNITPEIVHYAPTAENGVLQHEVFIAL